MSELDEQIAVIEYCDLRGIKVMHIPNEGKRSASYGAKLKKAGLRKGVPDLFFPSPRGGYHGLWIEMKDACGGAVTKEQRAWLRMLKDMGYAAHVCHGFYAAVGVIESYFKGEGNDRERKDGEA